ncbi:MAG: RsmD family RNA methyltransferase [Longimicrobiales bacterium]|nr:RsmD family RNA methyltransferase [Longimicrobiales bacterium]
MRIVAGRWAGRTLASPGGRVRPTAEAVRDEALTWVRQILPAARVLDLFAGTGALALEALSRGAGRADVVESAPAALHALKANVAALGARGQVRVFKRDALAFLAGLEAGAYDLALADPPYTSRLGVRVVEAWRAVPFARWLLVETAPATELPPGGRRRLVGDAALTLYRLSSDRTQRNTSSQSRKAGASPDPSSGR